MVGLSASYLAINDCSFWTRLIVLFYIMSWRLSHARILAAILLLPAADDVDDLDNDGDGRRQAMKSAVESMKKKVKKVSPSPSPGAVQCSASALGRPPSRSSRSSPVLFRVSPLLSSPWPWCLPVLHGPPSLPPSLAGVVSCRFTSLG